MILSVTDPCFNPCSSVCIRGRLSPPQDTALIVGRAALGAGGVGWEAGEVVTTMGTHSYCGSMTTNHDPQGRASEGKEHRPKRNEALGDVDEVRPSIPVEPPHPCVEIGSGECESRMPRPKASVRRVGRDQCQLTGHHGATVARGAGVDDHTELIPAAREP